MDTADLVAFAVVVVMAAGWLWFRMKTDRSVNTACLVLGSFQILAGVGKLLLSGIYGDYVTAITQPHYSFILWGVVQFMIAAMLLKFGRDDRLSRHGLASVG